ncbi:MAG: hypothetical protein QM817_32595 [Archangium sp.]
MVNFFMDGGWTMFPILLAGFLLTALSTMQALRPVPRRWTTLKLLAALVGVLGVLGFVLAARTTIHNTQDATDDVRMKIIVAGLAESSNNLTLMLTFLLISCAVCAVASTREGAQ